MWNFVQIQLCCHILAKTNSHSAKRVGHMLSLVCWYLLILCCFIISIFSSILILTDGLFSVLFRIFLKLFFIFNFQHFLTYTVTIYCVIIVDKIKLSDVYLNRFLKKTWCHFSSRYKSIVLSLFINSPSTETVTNPL